MPILAGAMKLVGILNHAAQDDDPLMDIIRLDVLECAILIKRICSGTPCAIGMMTFYNPVRTCILGGNYRTQ